MRWVIVAIVAVLVTHQFSRRTHGRFSMLQDVHELITSYNPPRTARIVPSQKPEHLAFEFPMPETYARVVASHVFDMMDNGWARELSSLDLYHGHLIMRTDFPDEFLNANELLASVAVILYHSDEPGLIWQGAQEGVPIALRTPRSIVGYWDGYILPAIDLIDRDRVMLFNHDSYGTVFERELAAMYPEQFDPNQWKTPSLVLWDGSTCDASLQFYVLLNPYGRFRINGRVFDVYLHCDLDSLPATAPSPGNDY